MLSVTEDVINALLI